MIFACAQVEKVGTDWRETLHASIESGLPNVLHCPLSDSLNNPDAVF
jgi:hypothetical protein